MTLRLGSLFSGYGGLEMGVASVLDVDTVWVSDIDLGAVKVLAHRYPTVPNLGDITSIDWTQVEPVDVLTGGFPCQDLSLAGARRGMRPGTRSGLWEHMAYAINQLQPRLVVIENVRGLLSAEAHSDLEPCAWCMGDGEDPPVLRALGAVLGDLADLGFDAKWHGIRAADVGAPHGRFRVFVVASYAGCSVRRGNDAIWGDSQWAHNHTRRWNEGADAPVDRTGAAQDTDVQPRNERRITAPGQTAGGWARPDVGGSGRARVDTPADTSGATVGEPARGSLTEEAGTVSSNRPGHHRGEQPSVNWGPYAPAIARWEAVTRPAPPPTILSAKGNPRLSGRFTEWLMGLPDGWVTDVPGVSNNDALKLCGNGVVPQQAAAAVAAMLTEQVAA